MTTNLFLSGETMTIRNALSLQSIFWAGAAVLLFSMPGAAQDAATLYKMRCAGCHAPDGSGSEVGKKLGAHDFHSDDVQKMSDDELTMIIANGKNKMPAYAKTLKPDDIKGLVAYIRSFAVKK